MASLRLDPRPFHCQCQVHEKGNPWLPASTFDQWGTSQQFTVDGDFQPLLHSKLFARSSFSQGLIAPCSQPEHKEKWCWAEHVNVMTSARPILPEGASCVEYGVKVGQSMSLVTIMLGEVLSLLSFRRDRSLSWALFRNPFYNLSFVMNICMMLFLVYSRRIRKGSGVGVPNGCQNKRPDQRLGGHCSYFVRNNNRRCFGNF